MRNVGRHGDDGLNPADMKLPPHNSALWSILLMLLDFVIVVFEFFYMSRHTSVTSYHHIIETSLTHTPRIEDDTHR